MTGKMLRWYVTVMLMYEDSLKETAVPISSLDRFPNLGLIYGIVVNETEIC